MEESFPTLVLEIHFPGPFEGKLTAAAGVQHRGRTDGVAECDSADGEGKKVARAGSTCLVLSGEAAKGR